MIQLPNHEVNDDDWPPCRLDIFLRRSLRWTRSAVRRCLEAGRVQLLHDESGADGTHYRAERVTKLFEAEWTFIFPPDAGVPIAENKTRSSSRPVVTVDNLVVEPWKSLRDARVFALHKPRNMEVKLQGNTKEDVESDGAKNTALVTTSVRSEHDSCRHSNFSAWLEMLASLPRREHAGSSCGQCSENSMKQSCPPQVPARGQHLFHVGRLDKATSGLILATDDGDLASALCQPHRVSKTYVATVRREPTDEQVAALLAGVALRSLVRGRKRKRRSSCGNDEGRGLEAKRMEAKSQAADEDEDDDDDEYDGYGEDIDGGCRGLESGASFIARVSSIRIIGKRSETVVVSEEQQRRQKAKKDARKQQRQQVATGGACNLVSTSLCQPPDKACIISEPRDDRRVGGGGDDRRVGGGGDGGGDGGGADGVSMAAAAATSFTREYVDVEVVVRTGKYRVVRRLLAAVGLGVVHLERTAVGPLCLRGRRSSAPMRHGSEASSFSASKALEGAAEGSESRMPSPSTSLPPSMSSRGNQCLAVPIEPAVTESSNLSNGCADDAILNLPVNAYVELNAQQRALLWAAVGAAEAASGPTTNLANAAQAGLLVVEKRKFDGLRRLIESAPRSGTIETTEDNRVAKKQTPQGLAAEDVKKIKKWLLSRASKMADWGEVAESLGGSSSAKS